MSLLMDSTPKAKKAMNKDEVALLIDLIQSNPVLTSKETNAATNKIKEDTWITMASVFNAKSGSIPRTKEQLKLKWDNVKKAARKRTQQIRMNNLKTGGGKPDFIPPDEILEKVSGLLGSTCTGFVVPFGGDGIGCGSLVLDINTGDDGSGLSEGISDSNDARPDLEVLVDTPSKGMQARKRKILGMHEINTPSASAQAELSSSKHFFGMPISDHLKTIKKGKNKADNDGRLARNLAIARYYDKKTEKLDLEIKLLRLELDKKENLNCNVINDV